MDILRELFHPHQVPTKPFVLHEFPYEILERLIATGLQFTEKIYGENFLSPFPVPVVVHRDGNLTLGHALLPLDSVRKAASGKWALTYI